MEEQKKIIFSGIQPTGVFTLGNYLGALKNWVEMQDDYSCIYCIVNSHAITVRQDPVVLRKQTLECYALLMACGIDPKKSVLFIQSQVKTHTELAWVLSCHTQFGELSRMTQFKDKSKRHADNITAGLFTYPTLMAADILLYNADLVPVGADQKQHVELTRDVAQRFNNLYSPTFTVPEPYIPKAGAKIMSLQDPTKKMSKSDENPNGYISILDDEDTILRKFKRAVTDSDNEIRYSEEKPGVSNLIEIYSVITGKTFEAIEEEFEGKGYGFFKVTVGQAVADHLKPIREKHAELMANKDYLKECYTSGAEKAFQISRKVMRKVNKKVGFVD